LLSLSFFHIIIEGKVYWKLFPFLIQDFFGSLNSLWANFKLKKY
jgi:hypothetical protein